MLAKCATSHASRRRGAPEASRTKLADFFPKEPKDVIQPYPRGLVKDMFLVAVAVAAVVAVVVVVVVQQCSWRNGKDAFQATKDQ